MQDLSYENEFYLHVNGNSFSYERLYTKTRFQNEAQGNSEMAYYRQKLEHLISLSTLCTKNLPILPGVSARAEWLPLLKKS